MSTLKTYYLITVRLRAGSNAKWFDEQAQKVGGKTTLLNNLIEIARNKKPKTYVVLNEGSKQDEWFKAKSKLVSGEDKLIEILVDREMSREMETNETKERKKNNK